MKLLARSCISAASFLFYPRSSFFCPPSSPFCFPPSAPPCFGGSNVSFDRRTPQQKEKAEEEGR